MSVSFVLHSARAFFCSWVCSRCLTLLHHLHPETPGRVYTSVSQTARQGALGLLGELTGALPNTLNLSGKHSGISRVLQARNRSVSALTVHSFQRDYTFAKLSLGWVLCVKASTHENQCGTGNEADFVQSDSEV